MHSPTLRSLARQLRLSHSTVSAALRNSPLVKQKTRERVQRVARSAGYRHNPLASAVMSELRKSHSGLFRGVLAVIILDEPDRPAHGTLYFDEQIRGARARASDLGFDLQVFV